MEQFFQNLGKFFKDLVSYTDSVSTAGAGGIEETTDDKKIKTVTYNSFYPKSEEVNPRHDMYGGEDLPERKAISQQISSEGRLSPEDFFETYRLLYGLERESEPVEYWPWVYGEPSSWVKYKPAEFVPNKRRKVL